jgi:VCBS repeat protein
MPMESGMSPKPWIAALFAAALLLAPAPALADPSWELEANVGVGDEPLELITGTIDNQIDPGDGFVATNYDDSNVTIAQGNGDGTFDAYTRPTGAFPVGIQWGNFGESDGPVSAWVTANQVPAGIGSATVFVALDLPLAGTDIQATTSAFGSAGELPTAVDTGDVNHDGFGDAVLANLNANTVTVLLGTGDMSSPIGGSASYPTGTAPNGVALGDYNGDTHLDVATANTTSNDVTVLLGAGDGSFGPPQALSGALNGTESLTTGDATGDSHLDLVVGTDAGVSIYAGNGDGTFQAPVGVSTGAGSADVDLDDLNGDNLLDLAIAYHEDKAVALINEGGGTFGAPIPVTGGVTDPMDVQMLDVRNVGAYDLAVLNAGSPGNVAILYAQGYAGLPASLDFGNVGVDVPGPTEVVTVRNTGGGPLVVDDVGLDGADASQFAVDSENCSGSSYNYDGNTVNGLAPNATCQVTLSFDPTSLGPHEASLVVLEGGGATREMPLTGHGVDPGPGPTATTGEVSASSGTGTTLNGTVDGRGSATDYWFEWGPTAAYGNSTAPTAIGTGQAAASEPIAGLTPGQTYHFRLVAQNASGTATGDDVTFVAAPSPGAVTGVPGDVTASGALFRAEVNPQGLLTTWWFEYGQGAFDQTTDPQTLSLGAAPLPVSATVGDLDPLTGYQVRVVALSLSGRTTGATRTFTTAGLPAGASTGAATAVGAAGATLGGTVEPNGGETTYSFEYGETAAYGSSTPERSAGSGGAPVPVSEPLDGLQPNRTYHFRLVAENDEGGATGLDRTFTTTVPPLATTGGATDVTTGGAVLSGRVDPRNLATSWRFEYGPTPAYGSLTPERAAGSGNGEQPVSEALSGLQPSTTYHYRLVAEGADGSRTAGAAGSFTTAATPPQPPAPEPIGPAEPAAATGAVESLKGARAAVSGSLRPNGSGADWYFQYGTSRRYGRATEPAAAPAVMGPLPVDAMLTGLRPDRLYHYRLVAAGDGGTDAGADRTFLTGFRVRAAGAGRCGDSTWSVRLPLAGRLSGRFTGRASGERLDVRRGSMRVRAGRRATMRVPLGRAAARLALGERVVLRATLTFEPQGAPAVSERRTLRLPIAHSCGGGR